MTERNREASVTVGVSMPAFLALQILHSLLSVLFYLFAVGPLGRRRGTTAESYHEHRCKSPQEQDPFLKSS